MSLSGKQQSLLHQAHIRKMSWVPTQLGLLLDHDSTCSCIAEYGDAAAEAPRGEMHLQIAKAFAGDVLLRASTSPLPCHNAYTFA